MQMRVSTRVHRSTHRCTHQRRGVGHVSSESASRRLTPEPSHAYTLDCWKEAGDGTQQQDWSASERGEPGSKLRNGTVYQQEYMKTAKRVEGKVKEAIRFREREREQVSKDVCNKMMIWREMRKQLLRQSILAHIDDCCCCSCSR